MPFTFYAEFFGLMALVPGAQRAEVLAVNGYFAKSPHHARFAVSAESVRRKKDDPIPDEYLGLPDGTRLAVWNISHHSVDVFAAADCTRADEEVPAKDSLTFSDKEHNYNYMRPAEASAWRDLGWIASATKAADCPANSSDCEIKSENLSPHFLTDHKDHGNGPECREPTDAIIRLRKGDLRTGLPHAPELREYIWDFIEKQNDTPTHRRVVPDHFSLEMRAKCAVVVRLTPFPKKEGDEPQSRDIYIVSKGGSSVRSAFASLPDPAPYDERHVHQYDGDEPTKIPHFAAYYSLLKRPPAKERIPWRKPLKRAIVSTECPPALVRRAAP